MTLTSMLLSVTAVKVWLRGGGASHCNDRKFCLLYAHDSQSGGGHWIPMPFTSALACAHETDLGFRWLGGEHPIPMVLPSVLPYTNDSH